MSMEELMARREWLAKHETELLAGRVTPPKVQWVDGPVRANQDQIAPGADMVNRPPHYQGDGIECIDAIRAALGQEGFIAYCRGNAIKYAWRAGKKHGDVWEDMSKAAVYAEWAAKEGK